MLTTHLVPMPLLAQSPPPWGIRSPNSWATSLNPPSALPLKQLLLRRPLVLDRVLIYSCHCCPPPARLALSMLALSSRCRLLSASASASCLPLVHPVSWLLCCLSLCHLCLLLCHHLLSTRRTFLASVSHWSAASCCLCLPSSAGTSRCLRLPLSVGASSCCLSLLSASRYQPAPLILIWQVDCHIDAAGTPPHQMPLPLQPLLLPSPLPPLLQQLLLLPPPTLPVPPLPLPLCQQHYPQIRGCRCCHSCHHHSICCSNCCHPHPCCCFHCHHCHRHHHRTLALASAVSITAASTNITAAIVFVVATIATATATATATTTTTAVAVAISLMA
jgi:hypothetical protein